ncbi:MAG: MFS transporter [Geobacteraceae bacterium]
MENNDILSKKDKTVLLTVFTGTYFFAAFGAVCFAPLLPFIQEDMLLSKSSLGLFTSVLYLGALISGFPAGWLSVRWGIPLTIAVGMMIQALFTGAVFITTSYYLILILLLVAGLGYGTINPATSYGIVKWFPSQWRATAMAVKQMGFTAGTMAAAATLPVLAEFIGWRKAVLLVSALVGICGIFNLFLYPDKIRRIRPKEPQTNASIKKDPALPVWKNREIVLWSVVSIFFAAIQIGGTVYMSVYMVERFSYSKIMAGMFLSITQGGGALGRIIWGRISDMYFAEHREKEIILVGFIAAATCMLFGVLPVNTPPVVIGIVAALLGFTGIGSNVLFLTHMGELAGPDQAGQAIGFFITVAYCGVVVASPLFGYVADVLGFKWAWVFFGAMLALAMIFAVIYTRIKPFTSHKQLV